MIEAARQHSAEIVGVGLDNYETPGFPEMFKTSFDLARSAGFHLTSHCDVNQADSFGHIKACIETLGVERIDHGLNVSESPELIELVLEHGVSLTGCPTFYTGSTACKNSRLEMHRVLADAGVRISLNTDDPAQFGSGWMSKTVLAAMMAAPFSRSEIVRFNRNAIQSAWISDEHRHELLAEVEEFCAESTH